MKIQKIFFSVLFLLIAVFAFSKGTYAAGLCDFAENNPADCCTNLYPGGDCTDVGKAWYVGTSCVTNSTVVLGINNAAGIDKQYNCSTGGTICRTDTNPDYILCGATCKLPLIDDGVADGVTSAPHASCAVINRGFDQCTSLCTNVCINGTEVDGALPWTSTLKCRATCPANTLRGTSGCISMDNIVSLLAPVFGTSVATFLTDVADIATKINDVTYGIDYYLLTATARNPVTKISDYNYNSVKPDVWLSADYADMSWALDPANATYAILQEVITEWTGLNLCTIDADCTVSGESCVGYFCQALVAEGGACTDNSDCDAGLYCNAGVCTAIGGGGGTAAADYLGVSNNAFSASIGYVGANTECANSYATKTDVHVCMSSEILDNINRGVDSALGLAAGNAVWINNGPPAFTANANDCRGWTQPNASYYGTTWVIMGADGVGGLSKCNIATYKFACCGTN